MSKQEIEIIRFDKPVPFIEAYEAQIHRRLAVEERRLPNALFLLEHEPVITLGRNAQCEHIVCERSRLQELQIGVHHTDRGGDVTYHGPGQLVAYPILDLRLWQPSIRWYLRALEDVLIRLLADYGLRAGRREGYTGVWAGGGKVAAIGIGVHNLVTFHGLALNVDPNMAHYELIVPCGIHDAPVTSLKQLLASAPTIERVMDDFEGHFRAVFAG